jgi:hypothetical protein
MKSPLTMLVRGGIATMNPNGVAEVKRRSAISEKSAASLAEQLQ